MNVLLRQPPEQRETKVQRKKREKAERRAEADREKAGREAIACDWLREFQIPVPRPDKEGLYHIPWDWLPQDWLADPILLDPFRWHEHPVFADYGVRAYYDRVCAVTGKWTGLSVETEDKGDWLKLRLAADALPTIGANGFVFRRALLDGANWDPYLFDVDVLYERIRRDGQAVVAKVKTGIVHLYCARLGDFARKQRRRIRDFLFFAQEKRRTYPWDKQRKAGILLFCLATVTVVPLLAQALVGFCRRPDRAWLYHVPVCWITLWTYGLGTLSKLLGRRQAPVDRSRWQR